MSNGAFCKRLGHLFGVCNPPTLVSHSAEELIGAVTEIENTNPSFHLYRTISREDAYLVVLQLCRDCRLDVFVGDVRHGSEYSEEAAVRIIDLNEEVSIHATGPLHLLIFYIPRQLLRSVAGKLGQIDIQPMLRTCGHIFTDTVIYSLGQCLLPCLRDFSQLQQPFIDYVLLSLRSYLVSCFGCRLGRFNEYAHCLAPWQERRAKELMEGHVQDGISLEHLAKACGMSPSGFSRGFKTSTGVSPYQWFLTLRIDVAMELMKGTDLPLVDIALRSGFADQSHFTRAFKDRTAMSPGAWRNNQGHQEIHGHGHKHIKPPCQICRLPG